MPTKSWKNHPKKLLRKTQIHFFFLTVWAAKTTQTEEFMLQNVISRPTVYRTGVLSDIWEQHSPGSNPGSGIRATSRDESCAVKNGRDEKIERHFCSNLFVGMQGSMNSEALIKYYYYLLLKYISIPRIKHILVPIQNHISKNRASRNNLT